MEFILLQIIFFFVGHLTNIDMSATVKAAMP